MTYLNDEQVAQLLKPINPKRVGQDPKGFSHVEAYEIRAHLNRIFGFGRWSADVTAQEIVFESSEMRRKKDKKGAEYGDPYEAWTVCYRTILKLVVCAPDGTALASYTEGAAGSAQNQPSRTDAHDNALKTSESQALKRCVMNLGDQFGLSLYNKGSKNALVLQTLIHKAADDAAGGDITAHITEPLASETAPPTDPADDPRSTSSSVPSGVSPEAVSAGGTDPLAESIKDRLEEGPLDHNPKAWLAELTKEAARGGVLSARVTDHAGNDVSLKLLLEQAAKMVTAA